MQQVDISVFISIDDGVWEIRRGFLSRDCTSQDMLNIVRFALKELRQPKTWSIEKQEKSFKTHSRSPRSSLEQD